LDEAKARCPTHKKKAWVLVVTASFWSIWMSRNRKVSDNVEIVVQITARQYMDTCKLWAHRTKKHEKSAFHQ
jgi:hypothetical protein